MSASAPVLGPAEVAALLAGDRGEAGSPPPEGLPRVAGQAARRLAEGLSRCLGAPIGVAPAWVAVAHPRELAAALPDPACLFLLRPRRRRRDDPGTVDPVRGRDGVTAVLELAPALARRCCDRQLGAPGVAAGSWRPSAAEWDLLDAVAETLAADLASVLGARLQLHGHESVPRLLAGLPAPVSACAFEVTATGRDPVPPALAHLWFAPAGA